MMEILNKNSFAVMALVAITSSVSFASDKGKNWSDWAKCAEKPSDISWTEKGMTESQVLAIVHPKALVKTDKSVEVACRLQAHSWSSPGIKNGLIVVYETAKYAPSGQGGTDETSRELMLAVFASEKPEAELKLVAKLEKPISFLEEERFVSLDTANYTLSDAVKAFGVRTSKSVMYAGGGGATERMRLFVADKTKLRSIFVTVMSSSQMLAGDWHDDGTRDHEENDGGTAVLGVLKTKTQGYFDLEKRLKGSKKKRAVFKWNGNVYATSDQDPVADTIGGEDEESAK